MYYWGYGAVGSATALQAVGQGFESPYLHIMSDKDEEFVKLMLDNDMDKLLKEVIDSEKVASEKQHKTRVSSSAKKSEQRISGPSLDQMEPVGKDFYKKVIAVVVIVSLGILALGFLF